MELLALVPKVGRGLDFDEPRRYINTLPCVSSVTVLSVKQRLLKKGPVKSPSGCHSHLTVASNLQLGICNNSLHLKAMGKRSKNLFTSCLF